MLQLNNIQKAYGSHSIFSIDTLTLGPGLYWLKGTNGSGKSTLLRVLAGMLPFKGDIYLNETISIRKKPVVYRQLINYAPAEPVYPSFISGNELWEFVSSIKKGTTAQLNEIKEALGIDNYLLNPSGSYSSGMLKKLSLLLAFAGKPDWILLDEPFTTLDQSSQQSLTQLIRSYSAKGSSFILTSHHDIEASHLSFSKIFLLKDKQLQEEGLPS